MSLPPEHATRKHRIYFARAEPDSDSDGPPGMVDSASEAAESDDPDETPLPPLPRLNPIHYLDDTESDNTESEPDTPPAVRLEPLDVYFQRRERQRA